MEYHNFNIPAHELLQSLSLALSLSLSLSLSLCVSEERQEDKKSIIADTCTVSLLLRTSP